MVAAIAIAATVVTLRQGYRDLRIIHRANEAAQRADEAAAEEELSALVKRYTGRNLAMGYGVDAGDWRSAERFELPLMGQNYFLDENALAESIKAGVPMAPAMVRRVLGCNDLWLVPHGEAPFASLRDGVLAGAGTPFLFPDALRLHFAQAYVRIEVGATYDVWSCPASSRKSL